MKIRCKFNSKLYTSISSASDNCWALNLHKELPALVTNTVGTTKLPLQSVNSFIALLAAGITFFPRRITPSMSKRRPTPMSYKDQMMKWWRPCFKDLLYCCVVLMKLKDSVIEFYTNHNFLLGSLLYLMISFLFFFINFKDTNKFTDTIG